MAHLIAIGHPDEATAVQAQQEAAFAHDQDRADDRRDRTAGTASSRCTTAHPVAGRCTDVLSLLFGLLFVPFFGLAVGAGMGALMGRIEVRGRQEFQQQAGAAPGRTSALFSWSRTSRPTRLSTLSRFGGTVLATSLSKEAEAELQAEFGGAPHSEVAGASA